MRKKISAKILVLVGVLFAAGAAGIIMGMIRARIYPMSVCRQ